MPKSSRRHRYVDLIISEARPSIKSRVTKNYRICTITAYRKRNYINLRIPASIQQKIIEAYSQGKQVRIFA